MRCLRCKDATLAPARQGGITRHVCASCGGMWIADDQLDLLLVRLGLHADEPLGPLAADKPASTLACPVCTGAMVQEASYGNDGQVVVDVCADHGAWFDRDELGVVLYDLQEEHVSRVGDHPDAGSSLNTALRALSTTVRFQRRADRSRGRPTPSSTS